MEQLWNGHPRKLDREIFEDCPSVKIGPLENFPLYSIEHPCIWLGQSQPLPSSLIVATTFSVLHLAELGAWLCLL